MPHALIAVAQWVGMTVFQAATAAGASVGTAATLAEVATAATVVAEIATVALAAKALTPKVGGDFGSQVDLKLDPRGPIPYAVGRTAAGGNAVFVQTCGQDHKYLNIATVYSAAGPIDSYESFLVNGSPVVFGADSGEGASGYYLNRMWRVSQLGDASSPYLHWTATGTKDTPANHGGMPAEWTSAHTLPGYAADLWCLQYNTTIYSGGVPKKLAVGKWVKVYDPRLDSTYPGGDPDGTHRALDESTYEWSANPYLHALTWLLGRRQNGVRILGVGAPVAMIDVAAFVEGANVADANGWTCGGVVYSTDDKWEVYKAFLQAGGGKPMRLGAKISCMVNTPRVSLATITGGDVVGKARITGSQSRRSRVNTIWPRYREELQGWEVVTLDEPVTVEDYYDPDGGQRSTEIEYSLVQDAVQAAQLARYDIEDARELLPIVLPCKPIWMGYKPGDCVTVDEPEFGLNGQKCLILQRRKDPLTLQTTFTLRSETDGKHPFALGQTATAPSTPALTGFDPATVPIPDGASWSIVDTELTSADGTLPAIVIEGAVDSELVSSILVEYREVLAGSPAFGPWVTLEYPASTVRIEITGLKPATQYQVRVRYRSVRNAEDPTTGTDLGPVTVGGLVGGSVVADTVPPAAPTSLAASAAFESVFLTWSNPPDLDLDKVEIWENTTNTQPNPATQASLRIGTAPAAPGQGGFFGRIGLQPGVTRYYWVRALDKSGNVSGFNATGGTSATTASLGFDDFASGIKPVGRGSSLPTASTYAGDAFFLTTDGKLYRKNTAGTAWTVAVPTSDLSGQITSTQITDGSISTPKLATGAVTANEIAANAVTATKILAGSISASHIASATITGDRIAAGTITASNIQAGTITADRMSVASLSAIAANIGTVTAGLLRNSGSTFKVDLDNSLITITAGSKVTYIGNGFGASSDLMRWFGPSSTAASSATKTNGYWAEATDGKVYYGSAELGTQTGNPLNISASTLDCVYSGAGSGSVSNATTNSVTITPSGGSGSYNFYARADCGEGNKFAFATTGSAGPQSTFTTSFRVDLMPVKDFEGSGTITIVDAVTGYQAQITLYVAFFNTP